MLDYSLTETEQKGFIKYFEISKDKKVIILYMADGNKKLLSNTEKNYNKVINKMEIQVKNAQENIEIMKTNHKNANKHVKKINIIFFISLLLGGALALTSVVGVILEIFLIVAYTLIALNCTENYDKIMDLQKNHKFLENQEAINENKNKGKVLEQLPNKVRTELQKPVFTINDTDALTPKELEDLLNAIDAANNIEYEDEKAKTYNKTL